MNLDALRFFVPWLEGPRLAPETPSFHTHPDGPTLGGTVILPPHPHSEYPQAWHFLQPSANSSWLLQSGQVPMKVSASAA